MLSDILAANTLPTSVFLELCFLKILAGTKFLTFNTKPKKFTKNFQQTLVFK